MLAERPLILTQCTPKSPVYNVYDFGARGDGITNDQEAIQKAISACENGTVLFP